MSRVSPSSLFVSLLFVSLPSVPLLIVATILAIAASAGFAAGQQSSTPNSPATQSAAQTPASDASHQNSSSAPQSTAAGQNNGDQSPTETLKVRVNVVSVFFNARDKRGALIPNLTKDDFDVFEDSKPQTIRYFTAESNLPLTLGILIDTSGSQTRVLDMEKEVGGAFLRQILTDKDEAFVINFDTDVNLIQDYTRDVRRLQNALNKVKINVGIGLPPIFGGGGPVPTANSNAGTVLYDAVYLASHDMLAKEVGRKALVLLTDGQDEGSKLKIKDAIEAAQKADAILYVLLCADRGAYGGYGYSGDYDMKHMTEPTGGREINVGNKFDKLQEAFEQISAELRSQYNLGYTPSNTVLDGGYRKLEIKSKQSYKIQARAGYYATAHEQN